MAVRHTCCVCSPCQLRPFELSNLTMIILLHSMHIQYSVCHGTVQPLHVCVWGNALCNPQLVPFASLQLPIHPSRKPAQQADQPKGSSKPSTTPAEASNTPTSHPHTQPVAPGNKQFGRVLKELQSLKPSSTHSGPDSAHPTAPAPHGADVLSVAIAIAEKASVLPSSSQHK